MGVPWNYGPLEFDVEAGKTSVVELKVPHRGTIRRLVLEQVGGVVDATFQLFSARKAAYAMADDDSISSESSAVAGQEPGLHSLFGVKSVVAGKFADYEMDTIFRNGDGTSTNPVRRLWLAITPAGSGDKAYSIGMTIEMAELNS